MMIRRCCTADLGPTGRERQKLQAVEVSKRVIVVRGYDECGTDVDGTIVFILKWKRVGIPLLLRTTQRLDLVSAQRGSIVEDEREKKKNGKPPNAFNFCDSTRFQMRFGFESAKINNQKL